MDFKFCGNCGAKMPAESKFCTECGSPFPKKEEKEKKEEKKEETTAPVVETPEEAPAESPAESPVETPAEIPVENREEDRGETREETRVENPPLEPAPQRPQREEPDPDHAPAYSAGPAYFGPAPAYPEVTKESVIGTKYEPVKAWGWIGIFLLIGIPLIGPLLLVIWACGGCRKQNKRTFARGVLLAWLIGVLVAGLAAFALRGTIEKAAEDFAAKSGIATSDGTAVRDILNNFLNQYGYELVD